MEATIPTSAIRWMLVDVGVTKYTAGTSERGGLGECNCLSQTTQLASYLGLVPFQGLITYICNVTPCSLKSCTLKVVASISLLKSSKTNTFQTNGPCFPCSNGNRLCDAAEADPPADAAVWEERFEGGSLRLRRVRRPIVWASRREEGPEEFMMWMITGKRGGRGTN